jgi:hypothetical protein
MEMRFVKTTAVHPLKNTGICLVIILMMVPAACRKSDYVVDPVEWIRDNGAGTGTVTWTKDRDYLLEGLVFVRMMI